MQCVCCKKLRNKFLAFVIHSWNDVIFQKQIIIKIFIFLFGPILSNIFGKPNQWDKWKLSPGVDLYKEKETHLQK